MSFNSQERLKQLRQSLRTQEVDAYIINTQDAHASEYISNSDTRRQYLTGFTGSAGTAIVTASEALLWTDSRYFEQAEKELQGTEWKLIKDGLPQVPRIHEWLSCQENIRTIGYDALLMSYSTFQCFKKYFTKSETSKTFIEIASNLIDTIWEQDGKPLSPCTPTFLLHEREKEFSTLDKINTIRKKCRKKKTTACLLSLLDDVAWITNLRASDIPYCPVFSAYMLITEDSAIIFSNIERFSKECLEHFNKSNITVMPYREVFRYTCIFFGTSSPNNTLWLDSSINMKLYNCVDDPDNSVLIERSPVQTLKGIKTNEEIEGFKQCHIYDAIAKISFLCWLEELAKNEDILKTYTEYTVAQKLEEYRRLMPNNMGLSFETISSIGSNSAIVHYSPNPKSCRPMSRDVYLVDSGGQYVNGTTDVTRTLHLGTPTQEQKNIWTYVLKGHLQLTNQKFPHGTVGPQLDVLCRQYLWMNGLNYLHGTGHGVGSFLNVHEGPHHISPYHRGMSEEIPLKPNMVVTNEPGYYEANEFGVRIENVLYVKRSNLPQNITTQEVFYEFEDLTLIPYQKKMINPHLLSPAEIEQINAYHEKIYNTLEKKFQDVPQLPHADKTLEWLKNATLPLI